MIEITEEEKNALVSWANARISGYGPAFTAAYNVARRLAGLKPLEGVGAIHHPDHGTLEIRNHQPLYSTADVPRKKK